MNPQDAILECFLQLSAVTDSYTLIHQYKKGHIELETFIEIVQRYDLNISRQDISNFYTLTLKEAQFSLMTQFILDQIFKKAGQLRAQRIEEHPIREPEELLHTVGKTLKTRGLDLKLIFMVFDRDWDQQWNQQEFQTFLEFYIPTISPQECKQVLNKYQCETISLEDLEEWMEDQITQPIQRQPVQIQISQKQYPSTTPNTPHTIETIGTVTTNTPNTPQTQKQLSFAADDVPRSKSLKRNMIKHTSYKNKLITNRVQGLQEFKKLESQYQSSGALFTDITFPTTQETLGPLIKNYKWNRLGELWGDKHQIFQKGEIITGNILKDLISANDVGQGELGDCYLVSVLASVAYQMPEIIYDLFITKKSNKNGLYAVKFCVDGQWQIVILDDYIPVIGNSPAFCTSSYFESWVILLEKAWAKLHGSYSNTKGGVPTEVEKCLTCGPSQKLDTKSKDFKERLLDCFDKKCIMTVGTNNTGIEYKTKGLVAGHAYSLLSWHSINHPKLGTVELVKIRNPYGRVEWNGDWGDKSPLWTPELIQELDVQVKEDGEFYMNYQDFISNYTTVFASYFRKNYQYSSTTLTIKKKNSQYFTFEILSEGEYYFTAYQKSARQFKSQFTDYQNSKIRILIGSASNEGYTYYGSASRKYDSVYVGGQFKVGTYVAQVKIPWKLWPEFEFTVSMYGEKSVDITSIPKIPEFTHEVMLNFARRNPKMKPLKVAEPLITKSKSMKPKLGLGYFYFNNQSNKGLVIQWTFKKMEGFKLKKPFRGNEFKLTIPAGKDAVVVISLAASGYSMQLHQSMQYF